MTRKVDEGRSRLVGFRAGIERAAGFAVGFGEVLLQKHLPEKIADKLCLFFGTELKKNDRWRIITPFAVLSSIYSIIVLRVQLPFDIFN